MVHFYMVDNFKLSYLMGCLFNQFKWFFYMHVFVYPGT